MLHSVIVIRTFFKTILVRTIMELVKNESYYASTYSRFIGPLDIAVKAICKDRTYSELYEIVALCTLLECNVRSIYPMIDFREDLAIMNHVFTPAPPTVANCEIKILWSHTMKERDFRASYNTRWNPNHFVPLMSALPEYGYNLHSRSAPTAAVRFFCEYIF